MPPLNWDSFAELPGSPELNFEKLCRALMWFHYAKHGEFRAVAAQPGVEFHLNLLETCALGSAGRWFGWQCRWYDLPAGRALGTTRRIKIMKAIKLTEKVLPDLTDWVLWTRRTLTKGDQSWFYAIKTPMKLHSWTTVDVENHLSNQAEILLRTYFGELVLTPEDLTKIHAEAVAPIRRRWNPDVHQTIDAERELRRMLAESGTWDDVRTFATQLLREAEAIVADAAIMEDSLKKKILEIDVCARASALALTESYEALELGDLDILREVCLNRPTTPRQKLATIPHQLRSRRHRAALSVTNAIADIRRAETLLDDIEKYPSMRLVAVVAEAGCGKTELAAQLTSSLNNRPPGVLLHGRNLGANDSLDDLANSVVIRATAVPGIEALVAAVDAAGQRAHRRIPIVIDGLNEAEDARRWKGFLAVLDQVLSRYPYVLVVCTLRSAFADEALPAGTFRLEIPDFEQDTGQAVRRYFDYYQINPADAELPWELLRHPLTLRLFCEVTNPKRERPVGVEAMPGSLTGLFDRYIEQASERIAELAPRSWRYYAQDVRKALDEIGWALWDSRARSLDFGDLRKRLGEDGRPWNESIVRALEQEGVLLRTLERGSTVDQVTVIYDALAGHLAADAILARHGRMGFERWLTESATVGAFAGPPHERPPLAGDTLQALIGLLPRRLHRQQLWPLLPRSLRNNALLGAADLEATYLDSETVGELSALLRQRLPGPRDLFDRLWHTRSSPTHPLNSDLLNTVLRPMSVAERDIRWTEWVRQREDLLVKDLGRLEERWRTLGPRSQSDQLRAQWVMWTLTSTAKKIRDQATRTLYWFGRGEPAALFWLTLNGLGVNDPFVTERLLAASYGVAMAHQLPDDPKFDKDLL
jgi:hypothetical protein